MAIIDLQRSIAEAGRIRIGQQVPAGNGKTRPAKLDAFRLTSPDKRRIEEAAALFGGTVAPWAAPAGPQWEVITTSAAIDVIVPPQAMAFSQFYELWSAGGCQRRCDGETESLSEQGCLCDPEERTCDIHTRLSLMIRDLPGLALWRLDTQGWYAARELAGAVEIMAMAAGRGVLLPARLLLEQRSVKRPGKDGKPQTLRYAVPRLDPGITPGELLALPSGGLSLPTLALPALADGRGDPEARPRLTPIPRDDSPAPTIAAQSAPPPARPARRNAAPELPGSGRRRNTATKQPGEEGYWRSRAFADGTERGIDSDRMRAIAAEVVGEPAAGLSMSTLDEVQWERIHRVVLGFMPSQPAQAPETVGGWEMANTEETAPQDEAAPSGETQGPVAGTTTVRDAASSTPVGRNHFQARFALADPKPTKAVVLKAAQKLHPDIPDLSMRDSKDWPLLPQGWVELADALMLPQIPKEA